MNKTEELNYFLIKIDDFIDGQYILADIKIVNLLKSIAYSKTLLAIFENCLKDFDYYSAKKQYLIKNNNLSTEMGEFVLPSSSKDLLAFVLTVLMEVDARKLNLNEFVNRYFYVDGSFSSAYAKFINEMIKPFKKAVKMLMESVIEGKVQDPVEALTEAEELSKKEKLNKEKALKSAEELSKKAYADSVNKIRKILLDDKTKIKAKVIDKKGEEMILIIDMLANALTSEDKDALTYAFTAYKFMAKAHKIRFFNSVRKISNLIVDVYNGI